MKFVSFRPEVSPAYESRLGVLTGDGVLDLRLAARAFFETRSGNAEFKAKTLFADLDTVVKLGDIAHVAAQEVTAWAAEHGDFFQREADVVLLAPLLSPGKFIGIGLNYQTHADESKMAVPETPVFFSKYASAIVGPGDPVVLSKHTQKLDYEVELAVVVGQTMKDVSAQDAHDCIFGYTVVNDVSARDLQLERGGQWVAGKTCDSYAPVGPAVVTADAFDPAEAQLKLWVNGELRQNAPAGDMLNPIGEILAYLSELFTLEPGDIIATGTPPGVGLGFDPPKYLKVGDVMRAEVSGIGILENRIVAG